jgi:probable rRNA maturation factor
MNGSVAVNISSGIAGIFPLSRLELRAVLQAMLHEAEHSGIMVEMNVISDADMEKLHLKVMGCPGPTNILSFQAGNSYPAVIEKHSLGWMALSAETLRRECLLYAQDIEEHTLRLIAHGLAHLLGLEHGADMDRLAGQLVRAGARIL